MRSKHLKYGFLVFGIFAFHAHLFGQTAEHILEDAERQYELGQFTQCLNTLENNSVVFDENAEWKAQKLRTLSYLGLSNNDKAKSSAFELMRLNPRYAPNKNTESGALYNLLSGIPVIPKFSIGIAASAGANLTLLDVKKTYLVSTGDKRYKQKNGFVFGISTIYQINRNWSIEASAFATNKAYEIDYSDQFWDLKASERLTYLMFPLCVKKSFQTKLGVQPFLSVGAYVAPLLYSSNTFSAEHLKTAESFGLENISSLPRRHTNDYGFTGAVGLAKELGNGTAFIQCSYAKSLSNINTPSSRFTFEDLVYSHQYIDDDLRLNSMAFSMGYALHINYQVVKE